MKPTQLPFSGTSTKRRLVAAAATAGLALSVAALGSGATATSAEDPNCPTAYPVADIEANLVGDSAPDVTGKTVLSGTTPEAITGHVLGTLEDGIAPGIPMIIVKMTSANVTAHHIWAGISGSPLYAPDGRLLGSVSYGFSGDTDVAGVTPAEYMEKLLTATPGSFTANGMNQRVAVPRSTARQMQSSGVESSSTDSFTVLKTPFMISNLGDGKRTAQLAAALKRNRVGGRDVVIKAGGSASTASENIPIVPGGNLAASISYGDITAAGVGTATAVCGSEVLAFGHPMNFDGRSSMTMHGARALTIIDDTTFGSWKMANTAAPVGGIDQDRTVAIHGVIGTVPTTSDVSSLVTVGPDSRTGVTHISVPKAVPDISLGHVVSDQDRILDSIGPGSGTFEYTVHFTRADGRQQTFHRKDVYADPYDISFGDIWDYADLVYTLGFNGLEDVKINNITTTSTLSHDYVHYTMRKVERWQDGAWHALTNGHVLRVRPGSVAKFRMTLVSPTLGTKKIVEAVEIPATVGNKFGTLQIFGGNTGPGFDNGEDMFAEGKAAADGSTAPTLDDMLTALRHTPKNDVVRVVMNWYDMRGKQTNHQFDVESTGTVVDGAFAMDVRPTSPSKG